MHGAVGSGTPPLLPTHTPEDLAGHQDDYGLLSQLFQSHSCNSTMFFNSEELYKYMSIYSSVTV